MSGDINDPMGVLPNWWNNSVNGLASTLGGYLTPTTTTTTTASNLCAIQNAQYAHQQAQQQALLQQYMQQAGSTFAPAPLTAKDAEDLMREYDHDGIVIKDRTLLFGLHMSKELRTVPLEYLVGLAKAIRTLRHELHKEVRRRRVIDRLPKK